MSTQLSTSGDSQSVPQPTRRFFPMAEIPVNLIGECGAWFTVEREEEAVIVRPREALPRRCTIRPAALFEQDRGFPDVNTVMGRLVFPNGTADPQTYRPFTLDPERRLRELLLPVESAPADDWPASTPRWRNWTSVAKRLCSAARVPWKGLSDGEIEKLVRFVPWPEPLEGCLLHALTQWTHDVGQCVIEIGSFRGRSASMLALALRALDSDSLIISIDPHADEPHNQAHVRTALAQLGEEPRLVQFTCLSDQASRIPRQACASLIFVDGDHSYEQVVSDFDNYRDLLAPGGCIVFHDYGYGNHTGGVEADPEVRPAVDARVMTAEGFKPVLLAHTQFAFQKTA
jgi:predicted O-methyltransferase YrrM